MARGKFITLEGGEGAGKTTQTARLEYRLRQAGGVPVLQTREPGGSPGAELIRELLVTGGPDKWDGLTEVLLFAAARRDHVQNLIRPALASGQWVICDRFTDSTLAYQGYGRGYSKSTIRFLNDLVCEGVTPDLTILLDVPATVGLVRAKTRYGSVPSRFEQDEIDFHLRIRDGFLKIAQYNPHRFEVIDAARSADEVERDIWQAVLVRGWEWPVNNTLAETQENLAPDQG